ncbi:MAG: hypothetical protein A2504_17305 [Bdellovibrionales bacterium RIFOXYD12_FULL_39_22]|nr:MAG: hypothetical protein A2385_10655 [Bdellovibrionales bacterium RIFOXYB1_FULL_39_21]OFZ40763.1 MAG: hypothetical protein A2485_17075 [Bdellovibrionales bacterium RIFOXYC12_FULL_39_17]OFZ48185.1 MAG: hypothetical protein A2404_17235 [Bdellovibrionales bacterium RIFOXYC1_FULL_39_130]OFZ75023.1 MAG: hypothetical protein A2451_05685 [Bdellovibrionales bacterium RIFOXYC2_FULL_39_8]OFZ75835.1 MAG: hypothetical protein A2560_13735 [Bdellovibrionales bacterium RIFOXYD1_FULL_39_84]OFZ91896.1 MAG:
MKKFYFLYQFIGPIIFVPVAYFLWLDYFNGNNNLAILVLVIPIITSYVIPGIGTNITKYWEFNTKFKIGGFRPHHGFVFGSALSTLSWLCTYKIPTFNLFEIIRSAFLTGMAIALINWIYDLYMIATGFVIIHNRSNFLGRDPATISLEYAPTYFGLFGAVYSIIIRLTEFFLVTNYTPLKYWLIFTAGLFATMIIPIGTFSAYNYLRFGHSGWLPVRSEKDLTERYKV